MVRCGTSHNPPISFDELVPGQFYAPDSTSFEIPDGGLNQLQTVNLLYKTSQVGDCKAIIFCLFVRKSGHWFLQKVSVKSEQYSCLRSYYMQKIGTPTTTDAYSISWLLKHYTITGQAFNKSGFFILEVVE